MASLTKRRKTIGTNNIHSSNAALRLADLPAGLFQHVYSYLTAPMQALFAVVLQSNNSISSMIILRENDNSWDTLDFGDIEKDLAAKLSDDDIRAILLRIDAVTKLKTLKLTNCVNISGLGLGPLAGSQIIEQIDLSLARDHQSPAITEQKISCDQVLPILRSIIERGEGRNCALKHIQFPWAWRELGSIDFRSFLVNYEEAIRERDNICSKCSARLPDDYDPDNNDGWLNINTFREGDSKYATQNYTCYKCLKHYCGGGCRVDDEEEDDEDLTILDLELYFCEKCQRNYCYECSSSRYCEYCEVNYCSDCVKMNDYGRWGRNSLPQCEGCHHSFDSRDSCNGHKIYMYG